MPSWWRAKDAVYLTLGVLLLLAGVLGIVIGFAYRYGVPYYDPSVLPVLTAVCVPTAFVPGAIFLLLGLRARRVARELVEFSAWVRTYRRVRLDELARKLGKTTLETERILVQVMDRGLVKGFLDRTTDEFVIQEAIVQQQFIANCPRCNADLQKQYLVGETVRCPYCNAVIVASPPGGPRVGPPS